MRWGRRWEKRPVGFWYFQFIPSSAHLSLSSVSNPVDKGLKGMPCPCLPSFLPFPLFPPTSYSPQASLPPQAFQTSSSGCPKPMTLYQVSFTVPHPPHTSAQFPVWVPRKSLTAYHHSSAHHTRHYTRQGFNLYLQVRSLAGTCMFWFVDLDTTGNPGALGPSFSQ